MAALDYWLFRPKSGVGSEGSPKHGNGRRSIHAAALRDAVRVCRVVFGARQFGMARADPSRRLDVHAQRCLLSARGHVASGHYRDSLSAADPAAALVPICGEWDLADADRAA